MEKFKVLVPNSTPSGGNSYVGNDNFFLATACLEGNSGNNGNSDFKIKAGLLAFLFFPVVAQKTTKPLKYSLKTTMTNVSISGSGSRSSVNTSGTHLGALLKQRPHYLKKVITTKAKYAFHNCKSSTRQLQVHDISRHGMPSITVRNPEAFHCFPGKQDSRV